MFRVIRRIFGRARHLLTTYCATCAEAATLRGMSDRELADIGLSRGDIDNVENGTYEDPREAIWAARRAYREQADAQARAEAEAARRIAA